MKQYKSKFKEQFQVANLDQLERSDDQNLAVDAKRLNMIITKFLSDTKKFMAKSVYGPHLEESFIQELRLIADFLERKGF